MAKRLCYARPTRSSWPLKQGSMGDIFQLKEDLEDKRATWQRDLDPKIMKSVWPAHLRTPEEDELSDECVCKTPSGVPMLQLITRDGGTGLTISLSRAERPRQGR